MRIRNTLFAMACLALLVPATAEAGGGFLDGARRGFGGRGGSSGPVRIPSTRPPATNLRGGSGLFGRGSGGDPVIRTAPTRTSNGFSGGQGVSGGGQRPAFRAPSRTPSPGAPSSGPALGSGRGFHSDPSGPGFVPSRSQAPAPAGGAFGFTRGPRVGGQGRPAGSGFQDRGAGPARTPSAGAAAFGGRGPGGDGAGFRRGGGGPSVSPADYHNGWRNGYRVGGVGGGVGGRTWSGCRPACYHGWFDDHHWFLTFSFGFNCGPFVGLSYFYPFHSFVLGCDYAFFYPAPVTYCYVPYGFYGETTPVYITRYEVVRETVPVVVYEQRVTRTEEEIQTDAPAATGPEAPPAGSEVRVAEPKPAAGSPATEKFLREASDQFRRKDYYEAAVKFRLAALSSPDQPGPLFALGQSLMAMGQDAYAARVLRKAVEMSPKLLEETGDITGVWADQAEYDRVMKELEDRALGAAEGGDAKFLLAAERYFAGDVRCRDDFDRLHEARPNDGAVANFRQAITLRFKNGEELPAIPAVKPAK